MKFSVLIVEDDPTMLDLLSTMIAGNGFTVYQAGSRAEALKLLFQSLHVDAVITDFNLSEGRDLVPTLRRMRPELPIIVLSGDPDTAYDVLGKANLILGKPIAVDQLVTALREVIQKGRSA